MKKFIKSIENGIIMPRIILLTSLLLFTIFTLPGLNRQLLWGDEAYRALHGINVKLKGYSTPWDGKRYYGAAGENPISKFFPGKYVETYSNWFQLYLMAGSYAIFGISTWTARLPAWLSGLLIFIVFYRYRNLFPKPNVTFMLTIIFLLTNMTFLVYTRLANYFSVAALLTLLSSLLFWEILIKKPKINKVDLIKLFIVNQFLLHTHMPTYAALMITQGGIFLVKVFYKKSLSLQYFLTYFIFSGVMSVAGFIFYSSNQPLQKGEQFLERIIIYLNDINFYIVPIISLLFLCLVYFWSKPKTKEYYFLLYIASATLLEIFLISYFNYGGGTAFRYVSAFIGLWLLCLALIVRTLPKFWLIIFTLLIVIFPNLNTGLSKFFTQNLLPSFIMIKVYDKLPTIPIISDYPIRCLFCEYVDELTNYYPHPIEKIIQELNSMNMENKKLDVGGCESDMTMFYTKGTIINFIPKKFYKEHFGKKYEKFDADIIVNQPICPQNELNHQDIVNAGYEFKVIDLPQTYFIYSEEFNTRRKITLNFLPKGAIYYKTKSFPHLHRK